MTRGNPLTGCFEPLGREAAERLTRIIEAGNREAPIFAEGEELTIKGARFRVLALDRRLLVLEGLPSAAGALGVVTRDAVAAMEQHDRLRWGAGDERSEP